MSKIFGIVGGWLISIFVFIFFVMFIFNIFIKDLVLNVKLKFKVFKDSNLMFKDKIVNMKKFVIDMMIDEVDDIIINKKLGFFKGLMLKGFNNDDDEDEYFEEENSDGVDDKIIKIVGFNKVEDEYLEILEGI